MEISGWSAEETLGTTLDFISDVDEMTPRHFLSLITPPPELWDSSRWASAVIQPMQRTQTLRQYVVLWIPVTDSQGAVSAILGTLTPVPAPAHLDAFQTLHSLHAELVTARQIIRKRYGEKQFIAQSPVMMRVLQQIQLAQLDTTAVWIMGEAGVGKEHIARLIHYGSAQSKNAFVPIDLRAIELDELESTLRRFRSSSRQETGFQVGTFYFHHVESASYAQLGVVSQFWNDESAKRTSRFAFGCTCSPRELVEAGKISPSLCHAWSVLIIDVPPLRERKHDLSLLAQWFLEEGNRDQEHQIASMSQEFLDELSKYEWPGNLDELRKVINSARHTCTESIIEKKHLPWQFKTGFHAQSVSSLREDQIVPLDEHLEQAERQHIDRVLHLVGGNLAQAARLLKISRQRLYQRIKRLGIAIKSNQNTV